MCEGFLNKSKAQEIQEQRRFRLLGWTILCGYVDPKKFTKTMQEWWPIEGDVKEVKGKERYQKLSKKRITFIEKRISDELAKLNKQANG